MSLREKFHSEMETKMAIQILEEYQNCGAVNKVLPSDFKKTRHLVPWFTLHKLEGEKQKLWLKYRLQGVEHAYRNKKVAFGPPSQYIFILKEKHLGIKNRFIEAYFHLPLNHFIKHT